MHPDNAPLDPPAGPPPEDAIVPLVPVTPDGSDEAITATPPVPGEGVAAAVPPPRPLLLLISRLPLPGFWLSGLLCVLMVFITQLFVPVAVVVVLLAVEVLTAPDMKAALNGLGNQAAMKAFQAKIMLPLLAVSQATLLALGVFALRLLAGRDWRRAVAVRRPSLTHLVVALVGFPALPVLAGGIYHVYSLGQKENLLPGMAELPALFLALLAVVLLVSLAWLVCRLAGRDWKRALAHGSLGTQLLAGVPGAVAALLLSWGIYLLISPYVGRVGMLEELNKGMEELV
ncbi:MAG TPA: hypothetical protein VFA26_21195, partial [Gemmataceae bacterium]|nr:hypothetical protein [Gemmataceae bacterium]